ncbi:MAG TPA: hypothetical protein VEX41_00505 [Candidatus Eisenbacteria bacterium]|nr:hypothetical protein [Candidatus Eisenbacteria bacterium]
MSKRHQVNRRRAYGRRQHELHERGERRDRAHGAAGWNDGGNDGGNEGSGGSEMEALRFFEAARSRGLGFAD